MDADARARELLDTYDRDCGRATMYPPRKTLQDGIAAALRDVERETVERCAKVADGYNDWGDLVRRETARDLTDAIRALLDERRAAD